MWFKNQDHFHFYDGLYMSEGISIGNYIKAYVALGIFLGKYRACDYSPINGEKDCEDHYTGGLYPEAEIQISIYRYRLGAYSRHYRTFDADNNGYEMYGIYVGYEY